LSVLDLIPITEGSGPADAFQNSVDLARHVEKWGYNRYWLAEHHNMPGIASSATSVVIGHIAGATREIRVGSAVSCYLIMHHSLLLNNLAHWNRYILDGLILGSDAPLEPIRSRPKIGRANDRTLVT